MVVRGPFGSDTSGGGAVSVLTAPVGKEGSDGSSPSVFSIESLLVFLVGSDVT